MGIDYNASVVVGYNIGTSDFMKFFELKRRDEVKKTEPRFNKKTVQSMKPITVIEQEGCYDVYFDGKKIDIEGFNIEDDSFDNGFYLPEELIEVVAEVLNCDIEVHGDHYTGRVDIGISSKLASCGNCDGPTGRITYGYISFDDVIAAKDDVYRIGELAKSRGVDLGKPGIYSFLDIC